jgi:hypothetical protein
MIGLANPAGLLALAAVAVLVVLHRRDPRRQRIAVATLFLWRRIPAAPPARRRFRPDALFALRLALVLALAAACAQPWVARRTAAGRGTRLVLVLDVTASMEAREARETRFALARRRASARVAALAAGDEAMVVAASDRARVVVRWTTDHALVQARLEALEPLDVPGGLGPALALALGEAAGRPGTAVVVLTDEPPAASGLDAAALATIDWVQVGATDDNVAVAGLTVEQAPFAPAGDAVVQAAVRNHARRPRAVAVEARVGGVAWRRERLVLAAGETATLRLAHPPGGGTVEVALAGDDALPVDDRALGWIADATPLDVAVAGGTPAATAALTALVAAVPGLHAVSAGAARVGVFDGVVPEPPVAGVYLAPAAGNPLCPVAREAAVPAAVVDWEPEHALTAGLAGLEALEVTAAAPLGVPAWGDAVVFGASGPAAFPLVVAGAAPAGRVACLAASLATGGAASDRLPLLLLALAALRWAAEPAIGAPVVVATGVPTPLPGAPTGVAGGVRVAGDPAWAVAERAGIHHVGDVVLLASLLDDRESEIGRDGPREWRATAAVVTDRGPARADAVPWLAGAALALLAAEWLAWRARGSA